MIETPEAEKCTCSEERIEPHSCPYKEEINDNYYELCQCCGFCRYQCAMDV